MAYDVKKYEGLPVEKRMEALKEWIRGELLRWVETAYACVGEDSMELVLEPKLEDLPKQINDYEDGTILHALLSYRISHGIKRFKGTDWLGWSGIAEVATSVFSAYVETEDEDCLKEASNNIYDLMELAAITGDVALTTLVTSWYFNVD